MRALAFPIGLVLVTLGHGQWERTSFPIGGDVPALLAAGSDLFFRSSDQGRSWARVDSASPAYSLRPFLVTGTGLFAAAANGVYRSTDSGQHWIAVNTGLEDAYVESLAAMGPRLFAGTTGGVYVSADKGGSLDQGDCRVERYLS